MRPGREKHALSVQPMSVLVFIITTLPLTPACLTNVP